MVIPAIDIMAGQVVRLYKGDPNNKTVYGDDPAAVARQWEADGADMLHIVDLDATLGSGGNSDSVRQILDAVSIPVQVAGGLRSVESALKAAKTADRIVVGTLAFSDEQAVAKLSAELGPERVTVSVDHKNGEVVVRGWQSGTGVRMFDAVHRMLECGITKFLLTNVERDGTMQGPDLEYLGQACRIDGYKADIIASGGISDSRDVCAVKDAGAWGVILGRALYEKTITIQGAVEAVLQ